MKLRLFGWMLLREIELQITIDAAERECVGVAKGLAEPLTPAGYREFFDALRVRVGLPKRDYYLVFWNADKT